VLKLIDELGFDGVDAGGLDESWRQQPGTPAYTKDLDAEAVRRALSEATKVARRNGEAPRTAPVVSPRPLEAIADPPGGTTPRPENWRGCGISVDFD
jgi:hypothetical protein